MWNKDEILREFNEYFETVTLDELYNDLKETDSLKYLVEDNGTSTMFEKFTGNLIKQGAVRLHYNESNKSEKEITQTKKVVYSKGISKDEQVFIMGESKGKLKLGA